MPLSLIKFRELFEKNSYELTGKVPDEKTSREAYDTYVDMVEFSGSDGSIIFEKKKGDDGIEFWLKLSEIQYS